MENILDSYKKIVHKAVDLGLLSEENKLFYLSSIDQSAPTNNFNEDDLDLKAPLPCSFRNTAPFMRALPRSYVDCGHVCRNNYARDDATSSQGTSLGFLDTMEMRSLTASDSDLDYYHHPHCHCHEQARGSRVPPDAFVMRRKPRIKEIVDFHIPIYVDIGKRKKKTKRMNSDDFRGFSSEDLSYDERNTFTRSRFRTRKSCVQSSSKKGGKLSDGNVMFSRSALEKDLIARDVLYEEDSNDEHHLQVADGATGKASGGLGPITPSKELNHQQLGSDELAPSKREDVVATGTAIISEVVSGGDEYCKMKEVLVVNNSEGEKSQAEKLLQVNIFCQLHPPQSEGASKSDEGNPEEKASLGAEGGSKSESARVSKPEKYKGSTKGKTRQRLHMLSKMFSKITLPSRFNK